MNKGITPHNYQLRSRSGPTLLRPSDFTSSTSVSTPKPTAPTDLNDLVTIPTTSLLLETAASTYTSPVILHTPLTSLQTTPTSATSTITTPSPAPIIRPLTTFSPPTQRLTFEHPNRQDSSFLQESTFFQTTPQARAPDNRLVSEHFSKNNIHSGPDRSSQTESKSLNAFPFHLQGHAKIWYDTLSDTDKNDWQTLISAFKSRFHNDDVILDLSILQTQQGSSESVLDYLSRLLRIATNKPISDQVLLAVALNGLKPSVKRIVMNKNPTNMADLRQAAVLAEKSIATTDTTDLLAFNTILDEVKQLKDEVKVANSMQHQYIHAYSQPPTNVNHTTQTFQPRNFPQRGTYYKQQSNLPVHSQTFTPRPHGSNNSSVKGTRYHQQSQNRTSNSCFFCGGFCTSRSVCRARNVQCHFCHKVGHFSRVCMSTQKR
ncbi:hypothetical protein ACJMK2_021641 [Sinanodonta woodiana]|uniref:Retrotransposon gag domain-containing protein n=1 Tax=Sinanodonta woodiana TaxID=1069815 RepID=A0ABD3TGN4_SINWO